MTKCLFMMTVLVAAGALTGGCQSTDSPKSDARADTLRAKDYFPLAVGNEWVYRSDPAPEGTPDDIITIVQKDGDGFFVDNQGNRLQARSNGIFDGDRFLLEDPLEVGHEWMAVPHVSSVERYQIVETDLSVSTAIGFFKDCVKVRAAQQGATEDGIPMTIEVLWTYAPGVGLIRLQQQVTVGSEKPREMGRRDIVRFHIAPASPSTTDAGGA